MDLVKINENDYINADNVDRVYIDDVDGIASLVLVIGNERIVISDAQRRNFLFYLFKNSRGTHQVSVV